MAEKQNSGRKHVGTRGTSRGNDARQDHDKLKENQQRLGVGPEHKTDAMKKGHRGTFP